MTKGCGGSGSIASLATSQYSDSAPFSRTVYDDFLLSMPSAQYKAGSQWQDNDKRVAVTYSENMDLYMLDIPGECIHISFGKKYLCTKTVDEDGCLRAEYRDMDGHLLISETSQGKTYYIYDHNADIRYVIPPALSDHIHLNNGVMYLPSTDEMVQKYAYIYRYDTQRHCIYKKLPGCEPIYYVYDSTGTCILSQDGNQRQRGEWTYTIPDKFGRPCISGICHNNISYSAEPLHHVYVYAEYEEMATKVSAKISSLPGGYYVHNLALASPTLYSATYYDNYSFIGNSGVPASLASSTVQGFSIDASIGRGLQTGSVTAVIDDSGVTGYMYSAMYYDSRYNVSQVRSTNYMNGVDVTHTSYSYTGRPQSVKIQHTFGGKTIIEENYTYTYDEADRLQEISHQTCGGGTVSLLRKSYNGLGQLSSVTRPIHASLERLDSIISKKDDCLVDTVAIPIKLSSSRDNLDHLTLSSIFSTHVTKYTYDLHSWLTGIDAGRLFREELLYADSSNPCYNGNISLMKWKAGNMNVQRKYSFDYDDASRLVSANYSDGTINGNKYGTSYEYDCMGNITSMKRRGLQDGGTYGYIDNLTLCYDGNRLTSVSDAVTDPTYSNAWNFTDGAASTEEYEYDANGNVTKDLNKGILSIRYNSVNLPSKITFSDGKTISYTYSSEGRKLRAVYSNTPIASAFSTATHTILYCGNLIYENGHISQMLFEGGYVTLQDTKPTYHYYIQDHLGNNRVVVKSNGTVEQVNHYYPYGGLMAESTGWNVQRYKYNGKELDRMHGLDCYDYGARWSNSHLGMWTTMDPLCEKYYDISPYAYCLNNPVNNIDPDGRSVYSKLLKAGLKVAKRVSKQGVKSFKEASTYADAFSDITENVGTIANPTSSLAEKAIAAAELASELLPVSIGDAKDIAKAATKAVHGNSKLSTNAQHAYDIVEKSTGRRVKTGISGGKIRKSDGKSYRAEKQVRGWNKDAGYDKYESEITKHFESGEGARQKAIDYERDRADKLRKDLDEDLHKRP